MKPSGAAGQRRVFNSGEWQNAAAGDVLKATIKGGPVLAVTGTSSVPSSESWNFVTP